MTKPTGPAQAGSISPGLRRFLYITAAITGAAVLVVEILGAKYQWARAAGLLPK